jgi:putrescine importer
MAEPSPRLERSLGLPSVVLFGLAYMAPMIVFGTFGVLDEKSSGTAAGAYAVALIAILLTAYSYGRMASIFPVAGSAYTYTRRSISAHLGFLVGWAVLLDYFFLPMVIWLIGAAYLSAALPGVPSWIWIVAFIGMTTTVNVVGLRFASKVNFVLMLVQFLIVAGFVLLCARYVVAVSGAGSMLSVAPFFKPGVPVSATLAGAALAVYSFLGFDAVSTLTEETVEPRKTMPRAILLIALIGGAVFITAAYFTQLAHAGTAFKDVDAGAFEIARRIGGDAFVTVFLVGLIVAQFTAGLSAQASVGRLLYAMGRDGVLPRHLFGYLSTIFKTPVFNIGLAGVVGLLALALTEETSTSFINFGAFLAFTFVNLSVIAQYLSDRDARRSRGPVLWIVVPGIGAALDLGLLASLDRDALILGGSWLTLGLAYLLYLTRLLRAPPPEMRLEEGEAA